MLVICRASNIALAITIRRGLARHSLCFSLCFLPRHGFDFHVFFFLRVDVAVEVIIISFSGVHHQPIFVVVVNE
ncbi:uncharacterized protein F5891DRAFT_1070133 [Suillus fuscotomentosus]|uniref:Uncharacterized protein n=1 Tax=Suillus fuscotomentosus TaxID=1912939 RepID=A0AAD4DR93_9AGAM|nr:uncharacterized protein F5891DRAFT_1097271 [Suillus fuscotomentosus]XP_041218018.1 uncharacterized protein F5891DRAFT_1070133 [Suillus fuscotomentosus]KAG1879020.1 hypothetical protein F5891DRAFT_1097271 [Suillus fuscotomentosus]KAG1891542.1 hypothetical protein F5891DRAFT_1070133 [Suillus fuscotomentosus]